MGELRALQHTELDRFWDEFAAVMGGPDGLMTYRYLGTHAEGHDRHHASGSMKLRSDMRGSYGLQAAPLLILVADVVGILDDAIAVPAPTQMSLQLLDDGVGVAEVGCVGEIIHEGRTQLFSHATLFDASEPDRVLGIARDAGVVVAPAPEGYTYVDPGPGVPESSSLPPLWQAFGAEQTRSGFVIPELTGRIGSTSASLHHGATQVVLEAAANEAASATVGTAALRLRYWHVTFTARGKEGPFVATTKVVADRPGGLVVDVEMRDEGGVQGRRIAMATAVFDRL